jgi:hypothetical protein
MEASYSTKEIIEMQFNTIRGDLREIKDTLKAQNVQTEIRFSKIEKEIDELRIENARYKTIWGIGATIGASVVAIITNKFFT